MYPRVVLQMGPKNQASVLIGNLNTILGAVQFASPTIAGIIAQNSGFNGTGFYTGKYR